MFDAKHYVPILTGKAGEYRGLQKLDSDVKASLTPVIEIPPSDWDFEVDAPKKTIDELVAPVADSIEKHWGKGTAYVDTHPVESEGTTAAGILPITHILDDARSRGLSLIPVTGVSRGAAHHLAVADAVGKDGRGACVRLLLNEINSLPNLESSLAALLRALSLSAEKVDLIVDLGALDTQFEPSYGVILPNLINSVPSVGEWRSLAMAGSAFPGDLREVKTNSTKAIRRTDWQVWKAVAASPAIARRPTFSDYAISSPEYVSLDFRIIPLTANIRYTHYEEWIIVRGRAIKKGDDSQYPGLATILRKLPQYLGREFSWGDRYIDDCSKGDGGVGSATTWRQVGTNHHLTVVVRQLASFPAT